MSAHPRTRKAFDFRAYDGKLMFDIWDPARGRDWTLRLAGGQTVRASERSWVVLVRSGCVGPPGIVSGRDLVRFLSLILAQYAFERCFLQITSPGWLPSTLTAAPAAWHTLLRTSKAAVYEIGADGVAQLGALYESVSHPGEQWTFFVLPRDAEFSERPRIRKCSEELFAADFRWRVLVLHDTELGSILSCLSHHERRSVLLSNLVDQGLARWAGKPG